VGDLLESIASLLSGAVDDPASEACEIVAALRDAPRHWAMLHRGSPVDHEFQRAATTAAHMMSGGMPFQYAVGRASFRTLVLSVDERVLIPRPETELLVDLALGLLPDSGGIAVDVGTGSGAIALSLAAEANFELVIGTDVSTDALEVAAANARRLGPGLRSPVEFRPGSAFAPLAGIRARLVVSNPPYIAHAEAAALPAAVRDWEPSVALFSGSGGMAVTNAIIGGAAKVLEPGGILALEVDSRRADDVARCITANGVYTGVHVHSDLAGRKRHVTAHRGEGR
jgi:release factor glutamine methyltransferase